MRNLLVAFITTLAAWASSGLAAEAKAIDERKLRPIVIDCYKKSNGGRTPTIQQMHDCSGVWVTPAALLICVTANRCPVDSDALTDRAAFYADIKMQKLKLTDPLLLPVDPASLPPLPTREQLEQCRAIKGGARSTFEKCVEGSIVADKYTPLIACFVRPLESDKAKCLASLANQDGLNFIMRCVGTDRPNPDKLAACASTPEIQKRIGDAKACIKDAISADAARKCLLNGFNVQDAALTQCLAGAREGSAAAGCLASLSPSFKATVDQLKCLYADSGTPLSCMKAAAPAAVQGTVTCVQNARDDAARLKCASAVDPIISRATEVVGCSRRFPRSSPDLPKCLSPFLGDQATKVATCVQGAKLPDCLGTVDPKLKRAADAINCLNASQDTARALTCVGQGLGGDSAKIACLGQRDKTQAAFCLIGDKPEGRAVQAAYSCISKKSDTVSVVAYCAQALPLDDKTREALSCVARAGGDRATMAACAAAAILPPEASRLVGCASSSAGATSFAICAISPAMNEEWRLVAECAVSSGGNPVATAGCATGGLTIRELSKCLTGRIGEDCFGKNNTLVVGVENAFNDILHGPGANNELVKAVASLRDVTGGPSSVINNPGQLTGGPESMINDPGQIFGGSNSVFNNPSQLWGGPNSVFNNPKQLLGGDNSVLNNPGQLLGGDRSAVREFIEKPLGGDCSFFHRPAGC